jgi:hypothetical protein
VSFGINVRKLRLATRTTLNNDETLNVRGHQPALPG